MFAQKKTFSTLLKRFFIANWPMPSVRFAKEEEKVKVKVKVVENESKHGRKRHKKEETEMKIVAEKVPESDKAKKKKIGDNEVVNFESLDSRPHRIGAHVSIVGGVHNALIEARQIGASACALFLRSPRNFQAKPLSDEAVALWQKTRTETQFDCANIVVHAPYLLNAGSPNREALERSRNILNDDLKRCDRLEIKYYAIHPGSTLNQISVEKCCKIIAESVNLGLKKTKNVVLLLENMAGQGNFVGSSLKQLGEIISQVDDKQRVGVCLDTCHAFAYGYALNTSPGLQRLLDDFSKHIGMQYLKALHVNDSKCACGLYKDRHENIGKGHIGKNGFKLIMNEPAFRGIPFILETPRGDFYENEIKLLHSLVTGEDAKGKKLIMKK